VHVSRRILGTSLGIVLAASLSPLAAQSLLGPSVSTDKQAVVSMSAAPAAPSSFGPGTNVLSIGSSAFIPIDSTTTWTWDGNNLARIRTGGMWPWFNAPVVLPSGAHVVQVSLEVYDGDAANDVYEFFVTNPGTPSGTWTSVSAGSVTSASPGWTYINESLDVTIDNLNNSYAIEVNAGGIGTTPNVEFRRALVYYNLQVSPAPALPAFLDVPTDHPFFQYIAAFAAAGITGGCGSGNFCPNAPLTRGQMAVFMSKALGLYWPN